MTKTTLMKISIYKQYPRLRYWTPLVNLCLVREDRMMMRSIADPMKLAMSY